MTVDERQTFSINHLLQPQSTSEADASTSSDDTPKSTPPKSLGIAPPPTMVPLPSVFSAAAAAGLPNPLMLQNALMQKLSPTAAALAGRGEPTGEAPKMPVGALPPGFPPMGPSGPPQQWYSAMNYVNAMASQQLHMANAASANGLLG
ncbi:hypothetical protein AAVH_38582, partial [Aphelenchoides avenae]